MFYTIIWLIVFLVAEKSTLAIGTLPFWGLVVAVIADVLWFKWGRVWYNRT